VKYDTQSTDSTPRLEGARYKYLTKLLMPTQPLLTLHVMHTSTYIINQSPPLLGSAMGLLTKGLSVGVQSRLDPCLQ